MVRSSNVPFFCNFLHHTGLQNVKLQQLQLATSLLFLLRHQKLQNKFVFNLDLSWCASATSSCLCRVPKTFRNVRSNDVPPMSLDWSSPPVKATMTSWLDSDKTRFRIFYIELSKSKKQKLLKIHHLFSMYTEIISESDLTDIIGLCLEFLCFILLNVSTLSIPFFKNSNLGEDGYQTKTTISFTIRSYDHMFPRPPRSACDGCPSNGGSWPQEQVLVPEDSCLLDSPR